MIAIEDQTQMMIRRVAGQWTEFTVQSPFIRIKHNLMDTYADPDRHSEVVHSHRQ